MAKTQHLTAEERYEDNVQFLMYFWYNPCRQDYIKLRKKYEALLVKRHEQIGGHPKPLSAEFRVVECDYLAEDDPDKAEAMLRRLRGMRLAFLANDFRDGAMVQYCQRLRDAIIDMNYKVMSHGHPKSEFGVDPGSCSGKGRSRGGNSGISD